MHAVLVILEVVFGARVLLAAVFHAPPRESPAQHVLAEFCQLEMLLLAHSEKAWLD